MEQTEKKRDSLNEYGRLDLTEGEIIFCENLVKSIDKIIFYITL